MASELRAWGCLSKSLPELILTFRDH
jgi:hypothetical protein